MIEAILWLFSAIFSVIGAIVIIFFIAISLGMAIDWLMKFLEDPFGER